MGAKVQKIQQMTKPFPALSFVSLTSKPVSRGTDRLFLLRGSRLVGVADWRSLGRRSVTEMR